jgi:hypothetical protein
MALQNIKPTIDRETSLKENLDFILNHLTSPLFSRNIMTKALGHQKEVFNAEEALEYFKASNYQDCRINAYSAFTDYQRINFTAPSFIIIDLDLKDFESQEMLDKTLRKTLDKMNKVLHGAHPTVLWTGGGYHIYQPIHGFVLEEIDRFECLVNPSKKDLTSRLMQDFFTDKKSDPQHRPSVKSCLIRIPDTINSKYNQEVRIVQKWDGFRPPIQYLLRNYRTWLVAEKINDKLEEKRSWKIRSPKNIDYNKNTIPWIEKLLTMSISDNRKYCIWRILAPYLVNIKNLPDEQARQIIREWLKKCNLVKRISFDEASRIRYDIQSARRKRFYPIRWEQLKIENTDLFNLLDNT